MAVLSAHGLELLRVEELDHQLSYRSNGTVLINRGAGWKIHERGTKNRANVRQWIDGVKLALATDREVRPQREKYRKWLAFSVPGNLRSDVHTLIGAHYQNPAKLREVFDACSMGWDFARIEYVCGLFTAYMLEAEANGLRVVRSVE